MSGRIVEIEFAVLVACLLAVTTGCNRRRGPVDAGPPVPVTVKLGGRISDIVGDDTWPYAKTPKPLSSHALERPMELTVALPGGKTWSTPALRVTSSLDDGLEIIDHVDVRLDDGPSCDETAERALAQLQALGVSEAFRAKRPRPGYHDAYPIDGCTAVEVQQLKRDGGRCSLYLTLGVWPPSIWRIHDGWPETCRE